MIHEHFRATGACEAVQGLSDLFNQRLQNDDVQDFDVLLDQAQLSPSETPTKWSSFRLYDRETVRNNGQPSYSRLKTSVRLRIDQTMRTRNFRVRNETVEKGPVTKSQKGKKAYVEKKVGACHQWTGTGQCSRRDSCSFSHNTMASGNSGAGPRRKGRSSSPALNSNPKTDGDALKKFRQQRRKPFR